MSCDRPSFTPWYDLASFSSFGNYVTNQLLLLYSPVNIIAAAIAQGLNESQVQCHRMCPNMEVSKGRNVTRLKNRQIAPDISFHARFIFYKRQKTYDESDTRHHVKLNIKCFTFPSLLRLHNDCPIRNQRDYDQTGFSRLKLQMEQTPYSFGYLKNK